MPKGPVLKTHRLTLRPIRASDAQAMARLINDLDVARMTTAIPHPYSIEDAHRFIRFVANGNLERQVTFALKHPVDGYIGCLDFHRSGEEAPEIGYWLGRPYWGQGLLTEAARGALTWAKTEWRHRFLSAGHFADNPASARVLIKAGFLYTGVVQQRFSLARDAMAETRMMVWLA